jgi:citrate lyase subunit beta/citryl-CoA lyase
MSSTSLPLLRSSLFVPANVPKFVAKAHTRGADGIILDLEDSIAPSEKDEARKAVAGAALEVGQAGAYVMVRINQPWRLAVRDIEASVCEAVSALILPMAEDAGHIRAISKVIGEVEAEKALPAGHTKLMALVETPNAYYEMRDIARADPRLVAMTLGSEDFSSEMGMPPTPDGLSHAVRECAIAARAGGIVPFGFIGTLADFSDPAAFEAMARQGRQLGFEGAFCIHPLQVEILNRAFAPDPEEIAQAEKIVATYEQALADGIGAIQLDGKMIDIPVLERARKTLAKAAAMR